MLNIRRISRVSGRVRVRRLRSRIVRVLGRFWSRRGRVIVGKLSASRGWRRWRVLPLKLNRLLRFSRRRMLSMFVPLSRMIFWRKRLVKRRVGMSQLLLRLIRRRSVLRLIMLYPFSPRKRSKITGPPIRIVTDVSTKIIYLETNCC